VHHARVRSHFVTNSTYTFAAVRRVFEKLIYISSGDIYGDVYSKKVVTSSIQKKGGYRYKKGYR